MRKCPRCPAPAPFLVITNLHGRIDDIPMLVSRMSVPVESFKIAVRGLTIGILVTKAVAMRFAISVHSVQMLRLGVFENVSARNEIDVISVVAQRTDCDALEIEYVAQVFDHRWNLTLKRSNS